MTKLVIKNFSLLTISNFINQFILVFAGIKVVRTLGPTSYGIYSYLFMQVTIYATISEFGLRSIVIRTIARNAEKAKTTFFASVFIQLLGLILCTTIMLIYEHFTHSVTTNLIVYIVINIFLMNLWGTCETVWQGHQKMGAPAFINVAYSVVWIAIVLITPSSYFTVDLLFKYFSYCQTLQVGTLLLSTLFVKGILSGHIADLRTAVGTLLKESRHYYFNNMLTLPTTSLSNNFLERNSTKSQLGYFNTSNRLMFPVRLVIGLGLSAVFPSISALWAKNKEEVLVKVNQGFPLFMIVFGWTCFAVAILSKEIVMVLFGSKFLASIPIMHLQIWFIYIFALNCFIGTIWGATDKQKLLARSGIANTLIATPALWLGSKFGGLGLASAYFLSYLAFFPFLYFFFKKSLDIKLNINIESLIVGVMIFLSSFLIPIDTNVWWRILLIISSFAGLYMAYYKKIKQLMAWN